MNTFKDILVTHYYNLYYTTSKLVKIEQNSKLLLTFLAISRIQYI
jgi:hypothetical protein